MRMGMRIGLAFCCWLLAAGAAYASDVIIDTREDWNMIVSELYSGQSRIQTYLHDTRELAMQEVVRFGGDCDRVEQRVGELNYLIGAQNNNNVFAVTLYSKQASDLKNSFDDKVRKLQFGIDKITADQDRLDVAERLLSQLDHKYLSPDNRNKVAVCLKICQNYRKSLLEIKQLLVPLQSRVVAIQRQLHELNEIGTKARTRVFNNMVYSNRYMLPEVFGLSGLMLRTWFSEIPAWLIIQVPGPVTFWVYWGLLLVVAGLPLCLLGRLAFRLLLARIEIPDGVAKKHYFLLGWCLLILAGWFFITREMLGEVESMAFFRTGQLLLGAGCLTLALVIRLDLRTMRQTLLLYLPVLFQYIGALVLNLSVTIYGPLLLLLIILNLPVALLEWLLVRRMATVHLDRYMGGLTVWLALSTVLLAGLGMAYLAFSITVMWFIILAGLQTGLAATAVIRSYVERHQSRRIFNCLLLALLAPAIWLGIIGGLLYWLSTMYNAELLLRQLLFANLPLLQQYKLQITLFKILLCVVGALVLSFVISAIKNIIAIIFGEQAEMGLIPSFTTLGTYVAWGIFILVALMLFNVDPSGILVVLGGMSMGLGFGLKDIVDNFLSGIILLVGKLVRPGDVIEYGGQWGKVRKVSIRTTIIDAFDNSVITISNSDILSKNFRNWSFDRLWMKASIKVTVKAGFADIPRVKQLLLQAAAANGDIEPAPEPEILVLELGSDWVTFAVSCAVDAADNVRIQSSLREDIAKVFKDNGMVMAG